MFYRKRGDTRVDTIEAQYGISLNARGDMLLGNLLDERGFDSLSQLLDAYYGRLTHHARARRIAYSFHSEDLPQVRGFRLMLRNPNLAFQLHDGRSLEAVDSQNKSYIRQVIREKIQRVTVVVCLIGNGTAWRDWVDWELRAGQELGKGLCGVRLKGSRGRRPPILDQLDAPVAQWDMVAITAAIECAAARRS